MKTEFLNRVQKKYEFVKGMGDNLPLGRFFTTLDEMMDIAKDIDDKGLMEDEQMYDVWELIMMFNDDVQNGMAIGDAREYLEMRLLSIIRVLQGEEVIIRG